jgi:hypothetical protein
MDVSSVLYYLEATKKALITMIYRKCNVGMSRILTCEQINIGPGFSLESLTTKNSSGSRLKVKLVEDKGSNVLYETCKEFYFSN